MAKTFVQTVSPVLATDDMAQSILFYEHLLGFNTLMTSPGYSIIERDGSLIHFTRAASPEVMEHVRGHTKIYIEVTNIRDLWEHVETFRDRYRIRDLFDRDYGMTEFHIEDPNGCLVFVGERTTPAA